MPIQLPIGAESNFTGVVDLIHPQVSMETRTAMIRVTLPNPDGRLLPGMFASVELAGLTRPEAVVVPEAAVIDGGRRQVVLVEMGEGRFAPREVVAGMRAGGDVEILQGLAEGERVVVGANFLIDAESNLKAALTAFTAGGEGAP